MVAPTTQRRCRRGSLRCTRAAGVHRGVGRRGCGAEQRDIGLGIRRRWLLAAARGGRTEGPPKTAPNVASPRCLLSYPYLMRPLGQARTRASPTGRIDPVAFSRNAAFGQRNHRTRDGRERQRRVLSAATEPTRAPASSGRSVVVRVRQEHSRHSPTVGGTPAPVKPRYSDSTLDRASSNHDLRRISLSGAVMRDGFGQPALRGRPGDDEDRPARLVRLAVGAIATVSPESPDRGSRSAAPGSRWMWRRTAAPRPRSGPLFVRSLGAASRQSATTMSPALTGPKSDIGARRAPLGEEGTRFRVG